MVWGVGGMLRTARRLQRKGPSACVPKVDSLPCPKESLPSREGLLGTRGCGLGVYVTVCLFSWVFLWIFQKRPPIAGISFKIFFFFLMWTIFFFKSFIEFVTILLLFYVLCFWPQGMWDLWPQGILPNQGWNPGPLHWKVSLHCWSTREFPQLLFPALDLAPGLRGERVSKARASNVLVMGLQTNSWNH